VVVLLHPVSALVLYGCKWPISHSSHFGLGKEPWCTELEAGWAIGSIWMYMKMTISPSWTRIQTLVCPTHSYTGPCNALHFFLVNVYLWCVTEQGTEEVILNWVQILIQMSRDDSCFVGYNVAKNLLWIVAVYKSMWRNITEDIMLHHNYYNNLKSHWKYLFLNDYFSLLKHVLQLNIHSISAPICFRKQCVFSGLLSQFLSLLHNHFSCWMTET